MRPRLSWRRHPGDAAERVPLGRDGLGILCLSLLLIGASGGLTLVLAMLHVARVAACSAMSPPPHAPVIVLGVRLMPDGQPGTEFRERLEQGAALLRHAPCLSVLGGVTRPGFPAEAEAGRAWLIERYGNAAAPVRCEPHSHHTLENLRFYRSGRPDQKGPVVLVTSRHHMARACLLARGVGLTVHPAPSDRNIGRVLRRLPWEGFLIHWYLVGRTYARLTRDEAMLARIS